MLTALSIRDIVLIDRLDLELGAGLCALTGETGAGKSIMLDALGLALGARGDGGLVRQNAKQGSVTALFDLPAGHPVLALLEERGIDGDGELVLRRVQSADGRTRAYINDAPVAIQLLREIGAGLVEIHGQHESRALLEHDTARRLLDAFAGLEPLARNVATAWGEALEAAAALESARAALEKSRSEQDFLRHAAEELGALAPEQGEETRLADARQFMMNAEKFANDLSEALSALAGDGTAEPRLAAAARKLERMSGQAGGRLDQAIAGIDGALREMAEARGAISEALGKIDYDQRELERTEERLFALRAAARKYNVPVDTLADEGARMAAALELIEAGDAEVLALEATSAAARSAYEEKAHSLSAKRVAAAKKLDRAVLAELPPLKLEKAIFETEVANESAGQGGGPDGFDRIVFKLAANPGTTPAPLMKAASGGELARIILALKVVLAERGSAPTLVFDEIDAGVSGATAEAIGVRLARLAEQVQVLAVTHSPQVAACAGGHFRVSKSGDASAISGQVVTRVEELDAEQQREEVARMLAGATVTEEARAAARSLIGGSS